MVKYGLVPHPALPLDDPIFSNKTWKHHILDTQSSALCLGCLALLYSFTVLISSFFPYLSFLLCTWKQHNAVRKELLYMELITVIVPQSNEY